MEEIIEDAQERVRALDVSKSFIVQAPAGSGKTTLLTQRLLALLAVSKEPEACLAITFTRKAALEMRERVLQALQLAMLETAPKNKALAITWQLGRQVLAVDRMFNWNLLENPNRLKIETIDAFSASLVKKMPVVSRFGASPEIVHDANVMYLEAAKNLLLSDLPPDLLEALDAILLNFDNDLIAVRKFLAEILEIREQWLYYIFFDGKQNLREVLQNSIRTIVAAKIDKLLSVAPTGNAIPRLLKNLGEFFCGSQHKLKILYTLESWPGGSLQDLKYWQAIAEVLLTQKGEPRANLNKIAPDKLLCKEEREKLKEIKQSLQEYINILSEHHEFCERLYSLKTMPDDFSDAEFVILDAVIKILPTLTGHLSLIFRTSGKADFSEVALGTLEALRSLDAPTDLALIMDFKIQHILVDEFQDTSNLQYSLLELLTEAWQDDGRTLFLVGDPMQSIYRFRQANVGLFLKTKAIGINNIKLASLSLTVNFRATTKLVEYINDFFKDTFPRQDDINLGAVSYVPSIGRLKQDDSDVNFIITSDQQDEALTVVNIIKYNLQQKIAILVRSRSHLKLILAALKEHKISYSGIEIELLWERQVIQDLFALMSALLNLADRIAWLSVLRAPYLGLKLQDLEKLKATTILEAIENDDAEFDDDAKIILSKARRVFQKAMNNIGRSNLRDLVYATWIDLQGDAVLSKNSDLQDAEDFFGILEKLDGLSIKHIETVKKILQNSYSSAYDLNAAVEVMTIHKAKGLEFDVVIIPALHKKPSIDKHKLLIWDERVDNAYKNNVLLAAYNYNSKGNGVYDFIRSENDKRQDLELSRLLYVALTRAKKKIYLLSEELQTKPVRNSFLGLGYAKFKQYFADNILSKDAVNVINNIADINLRLPLSYIKDISDEKIIEVHEDHEQYNVESYFDKTLGIIVHYYFYLLAMNDINERNELLSDLDDKINYLLRQHGIVKNTKRAVFIIRQAIDNILLDQKGQWLLSQEHKLSLAEWEVPYMLYDNLKTCKIDRFIIDDNNIHWIIDYKICKRKDLKSSITQYYDQLMKYFRIAVVLFPRAQFKLAVYFPLQRYFHVYN